MSRTRVFLRPDCGRVSNGGELCLDPPMSWVTSVRVVESLSLWLGLADAATSLSVVFHCFFLGHCWGGGQVVRTGGGSHRPVKSVAQAFSQGHALGRCSDRGRAAGAIRAGT